MSATEMLRSAIMEKKMVHRDVAKRAGLTEVELSHILAGRRPLRIPAALRLERVLGVKADDVLTAQVLAEVDEKRKAMDGDWGSVAPLAMADKDGMAI